ncbi:hypothetical protein PHMEG_00034549 [Phytophthora megakarya]|uniref:Uncharacterized protein n=1 Tax=Phytophthora megakarya TaxID=4795 RepID=A0A225UQS8_9STRA|nr:hypothetical protein PHMEG_00034549 [Phytophthora megakarya]
MIAGDPEDVLMTDTEAGLLGESFLNQHRARIRTARSFQVSSDGEPQLKRQQNAPPRPPSTIQTSLSSCFILPTPSESGSSLAQAVQGLKIENAEFSGMSDSVPRIVGPSDSSQGYSVHTSSGIGTSYESSASSMMSIPGGGATHPGQAIVMHIQSTGVQNAEGSGGGTLSRTFNPAQRPERRQEDVTMEESSDYADSEATPRSKSESRRHRRHQRHESQGHGREMSVSEYTSAQGGSRTRVTRDQVIRSDQVTLEPLAGLGRLLRPQCSSSSHQYDATTAGWNGRVA